MRRPFCQAVYIQHHTWVYPLGHSPTNRTVYILERPDSIALGKQRKRLYPSGLPIPLSGAAMMFRDTFCLVWADPPLVPLQGQLCPMIAPYLKGYKSKSRLHLRKFVAGSGQTAATPSNAQGRNTILDPLSLQFPVPVK